jgi:type II secretory pathway component PulJ
MITKPFAVTTARRPNGAFTLMELLISVAVLAIIIFMLGRLATNSVAVTRTSSKHIDTDTQARAVLDRMALDFGRMLKRTDVDIYVKAPAGYRNPKAHCPNGCQKLLPSEQGNDQMAFFSQVPGYQVSAGSQSPLSLVAYRINNNPNSARYLQLERMGKGLLWNGVSNTTTGSNPPYPIVFIPGQIQKELNNSPGANNPWSVPWSAAIYNDNTAKSTDNDGAYEAIGPGVFRLEYYYLLKDGSISSAPRITGAVNWGDSSQTLSAKINAFSDVEAIAVVIAVIDPAGRSLVYPNALFNLMSDMADFADARGLGLGAQKIGDVENSWNQAVQSAVSTGRTSDGSAFPPAAASAIRIYNRYFDVRTPALF